MTTAQRAGSRLSTVTASNMAAASPCLNSAFFDAVEPGVAGRPIDGRLTDLDAEDPFESVRAA